MASMEESNVDQEVKIEPVYPGVTVEAFNFLVNIATNHDLPQILKAQEIEFEVISPIVLGGTAQEAGLKLTMELLARHWRGH